MINTNMRKGFTMIELIFVIVIIGILAAVAIPKLANTAGQAHNSVVQAFVGTMNRTVGPTMWSATLAAGNTDGDINGSKGCTNIGQFTNIPDEVKMATPAGCDLDVVTTTGASGTITFKAGTSLEAPSWDYNATGLATND